MYLAGLMADETKISEAHLQDWVEKAYWGYLSEYAVPWVAAETAFGFKLGMKWIKSSEENIASAGWSTLSSYASLNDDSKLDIEAYSRLLDKVAKDIHKADNRVRYVMNNFVIAVGTYINSLTEKSIEIATKIGQVYVDMGGTACKVPLASDYIHKVIKMNKVGKKRKSARC
jgi:hypothetical protein